jgi:beta-phosphoglucomutase-like phosphatase (HAD superfamily)
LFAALRERWPLGLASSYSSNREIIELFLKLDELAGTFAATVSSEEVARGKPAPDVYLAAAEKMGVDPAKSAVVEDSSNGLRAAAAAGMTVIAVPNPHYPPTGNTLNVPAATVDAIAELTPGRPRRWLTRHRRETSRRVRSPCAVKDENQRSCCHRHTASSPLRADGTVPRIPTRGAVGTGRC